MALVEAAAEGVPAITSDLSGVGRFISKLPRNKKNPGIFIVNNDGKNTGEVTSQLAGMLYDYAEMSRSESTKILTPCEIASSALAHNVLNAFSMPAGPASFSNTQGNLNAFNAP